MEDTLASEGSAAVMVVLAAVMAVLAESVDMDLRNKLSLNTPNSSQIPNYRVIQKPKLCLKNSISHLHHSIQLSRSCSWSSASSRCKAFEDKKLSPEQLQRIECST